MSDDVFRPSSGLPPDVVERACAEPVEGPGPFGEPPASLARLHCPRFVDAFWSRMVETMLAPARTDRSRGTRRVQVLGQRIFEFARDGTVSVRDWGPPPHGEASHRAVPAATAPLGRIPCDEDWIERFREGFVFEHQGRVAAGADERARYADWVFAEILPRIRDHFDLDWMRAQIAAALALDPDAASLAADAASRPDRSFDAETYNAALKWLRGPVGTVGP